ncbi:hypothetical protein BH11PSE11_BH11PSE11_03400 [soil metagenome]
MRVDRQDCSRNHAGGSFCHSPERRSVGAAALCSPSKEAIREYMARRRNAETPPPSQGEIQRQLGWKFERGEPQSEKLPGRRAADSRAPSSASDQHRNITNIKHAEADATGETADDADAQQLDNNALDSRSKSRLSSDQSGYVLNSVSISPGNHPVLAEAVEGLAKSCADAVDWVRERMILVSRRWKDYARSGSRH